ncbi:PREDICTED: poly(A)-specific ribonuclease PARN-like domain-containing protein 1 [Branchiostoma belcheri]|uniref:Poly(A)-specific ribonuclease PARN-like domain-containing protein 1 n=1 Tax=Branchiostoma belcheri TaxID=7741 RepID=A0A6P5AAD0_BRABE|nr:PREDICTED: poly(A)-specific ribonuclease PARN-like domain-containing protein 1 [Branchiostoma belcheri]
MCDVKRDEFLQLLPEIRDRIQDCDFVAIDTEFTGLCLSEACQPSLFDTPQERYRKLRQTVGSFIVCQVGVSVFKKDMKYNRFDVWSYNFHLFPQSFANLDVRFSCQASSFEFLCQHNFDFNKFVYEGVPYLDQEQEKLLRKHLDQTSWPASGGNQQDQVQLCCSTVSQWLSNGSGTELNLPAPKGPVRFLIHRALRTRFPEVWTYDTADSQIIVRKVSQEKRKEEEEKDDLADRALEYMLGFTHVLRTLTQARKPVVGHNMLMDLMLLYGKMYKPLPEKYAQFKRDLHQLFPCIYDTKHIAAELKKPLAEFGVLQSSVLQDLYDALSSHKGKFMVLHSPAIVPAAECDRYINESHPHEAGYDSYMAGYVFIRMAHLITMQGISKQQPVPPRFRRYLEVLRRFQDKVNVIRASIDHICLSGEDPVSRRPQWLYVTLTQSRAARTINSAQIAEQFSAYGSVDIQPLDANHFLVAAHSFYCAKDILRAYRSHKLIHVTYYNMWKHSRTVQALLWTSIGVSVLGIAWTFLGKNS